MRLPKGGRVGSVQSLGRHDINAPGRKLASELQVTAGIVSAVNSVADAGHLAVRIHDEQKMNEARERSEGIQRDLSALHGENQAKQTWDLENDFDREKLEGVQFEKKDRHGNYRTVLSSDEVYGQVWAINRDKILKQGMQGMSPAQKEAINKSLLDPIAGMDQSSQQQSIVRKSKALRQEDIAAANQAVKDGKLGKGMEIIADSAKFSDHEKSVMIGELQVNDERTRSDATLFGGDVALIAGHLNELNPETYNGVLSPTEVNSRRLRSRKAARYAYC